MRDPATRLLTVIPIPKAPTSQGEAATQRPKIRYIQFMLLLILALEQLHYLRISADAAYEDYIIPIQVKSLGGPDS